MGKPDKSIIFKKRFQEEFRNIDFNDFFESNFFKKYSEYLSSEEITTLVNDTRENEGTFVNEQELLDAGIEFLNSPEYKEFMEITSTPKVRKEKDK